MSKKHRSAAAVHRSDRRGAARAPVQPGSPTDRRTQIGLLIAVIVLVAVVVIGADFVLGLLTGSGGSPAPASPTAPTATVPVSPTQLGVRVQGVGGYWTSVSPDQLAQMLQHKDFTLVNVKTPYMGEIDGTDLYIPYDQIKAQASQLPADKNARILVYCRSGVESAQAAQSLLDLGYTNVWNLTGGMNAWTASGRQLVQKNR